MYHGAMFPALANIAEEGFDRSACSSYDGNEVFVSNRR
jgi:hypothetical protein